MTQGCYPGCYYYSDSCFRKNCFQKPLPRPPFLESLLQAKLAGFYVPEIEDVYLREEGFQIPHALALDFGH